MVGSRENIQEGIGVLYLLTINAPMIYTRVGNFRQNNYSAEDGTNG
jgi:hypothetical protein